MGNHETYIHPGVLPSSHAQDVSRSTVYPSRSFIMRRMLMGWNFNRVPSKSSEQLMDGHRIPLIFFGKHHPTISILNVNRFSWLSIFYNGERGF
ncbi:hypothetical protein CpB0052 [Chlamydia pneumoniae TW-183]|uniref:Uncharacterized protein n=2 Tax=Chlamydia pneumoniae TaxID=83558 RepID=A0A0F7XV54_CHLPN|nr:hypothetical protein CPn_0051 [Chlamydia pneumoniae CWL029]AAP97985.1 hypothetical protein CpB0052 [Chlamydia pneumoniae TW-183]CRI32548.1 Uncharacterized protein BN1224_Wien1_A_00550 [Chlamydia pneumoniae]BAA98262.1 hypothetical protein [Chlamydia pneumoniae J138]CRI35407.1 Uncharacterized protein BN1224_CM1_A_00540 [Chlamydia pneumoniae]